jgi:hypothetical protein
MCSSTRAASCCLTAQESFQQKLKLPNDVRVVTLTGAKERLSPPPTSTLFQMGAGEPCNIATQRKFETTLAGSVLKYTQRETFILWHDSR